LALLPEILPRDIRAQPLNVLIAVEKAPASA
jgi:hypothetical protein